MFFVGVYEARTGALVCLTTGDFCKRAHSMC